MKRKILLPVLLALFIVSVFSLQAQTTEYSFTTSTTTYTPITGGILLGTETSDDQRFVDPATPAGGTVTTGPGFDIGFNFTFNGAVFDRLAINNNGWISLGQSALTPSVNNSSSTAYLPLSSTTVITPEQLTNRISGLARDLQAQTGSSLRLETIGTAPNRKCIIQWSGYKKYSTSGTGDNFSFQIQLHETTNNAQIVYGSFTCNATAGNMQVGLRGPLATDFQARQGTTGWDNTTAATANNQYIIMTDVYFPANGLTYTFGFPVANQPPNPANLTSPANGATLVSPTVTLNWLSGGGLPTGYRIALGTNNPPSNIVSNADLGAVNTYNPDPDLQASTTYYWKVTPYNAFGDAANCPVWSFTTHGDATITTLPYTQNWDAVTAPALPFDWLSLIQGDTTPIVATYATTPNSTPNSARVYNGTTATNEALLIAPPLSVSIPANTTRLKFFAKAGGANYILNVGVMTDPSDLSTFVQLGSITPTTAWIEYTVPLNAYTGNGVYIAFRHGQGGTGRNFYLDDIQIELIAANDLACTALSGNTTPSVNNATTYTASVFNWGTVSQTNYTVKLFNSTGTELATAAGVTCTPGATVTVPLIWTPAAEGPVTLYAKVFLTGDQNTTNDQSPNLNITVMPAGVIVVTVGDGNLAEGVPIEFFYKNSLFQCLYYPTEIGMVGNITALTFYNNFITNLPAMPVKFWLGQTDLADLSAGWILPTGNLTLVYDGTVDFPSGINTITIPLQTQFPYTGGNLVLYANRPMDTVYYSSSDNFQAQTIGTTRARKLFSDSVTYDPLAPSAAGTLSGTFPKTTFHLTPLGTDPLFFVSPTSKNYGTVLQNSTHNQTFTMLNGGGGTLTINSISISGSPFFSLQNLPTFPVNLTTGQTSTFVGRYNPTAAGAHTATITITDNRGNRMTHTVALSGNCIDPVVHTLPYAQNFDGVTPPTLPVEWSSLYQATVTTGYVKTVITSPHSAPNCVAMYNPTDLNTIAMLIAPPLDAAIPMTSVRVKFWAKGSTTHHMIVGVMTDPANASTFTLAQDFTLTATWTEYIVSLTGFAGPGSYIAFKHGSTATGQTMYIDDVSFEPIAPNDLACTLLQGNTTPSVGNATTYTASVFNWGTATQNTYTVKLYSSTGTELATATGVQCSPNTTVQVPLIWTPTTEGSQTIYAKVILTGDINTSNDQSPNLTVVVQAAGSVVVTIGEGNLVEGVPVDFYYKNSIFQTLYYPAEIGVYGMITTLSFYNNFVTNLPTMPVKIWMGQTNLADLSAGWILPAGNLTLVYDGTVNFPSGENTVSISLQTPFFYSAGNLVLYANRPMDTVYYNSNDNFKTQTIGTNRARKLVSDSVTYDPLAPSAAGTLSGSFPKTTISFVPGGLAALNGTVTSGGSPLGGVDIAIGTPTPMHQTTAADGTYNFPYVLPGNYTVTATKLGYDTQSAQVALVEDQTSTQNFNLVASVTVSVTGTVYGSDAPTIGLVGAEITLDGPLDYTGTTNAQGQFTIPNVLSGNTYQYTISKVGYQNMTGSIVVAATNYSMGSLTMPELATPPRQVTATLNTNPVQINLTWMTPGTGGGGGAGDFEGNDGGWVPSSNWTNPLGDWEWTGDYDVADWAPTYTGTSVVPPPTAHSGTGMWGTKINTNYTNSGGFNYLTKEFNLSGLTNPELRFWSWENTFGNFDYCQVAVNGTVIWGPSWQYTATAWTERVVSLSAYAGLANVQIQFQMYATTTVNYAGWYIDDVYVGAAQGRSASYAAMQMPAQFNGLSEEAAAQLAETLASNTRSNPSRSALQQANPPDSRALLGYKVWRLTQGNETAENTWTQLTANTITDTTWIDSSWATLPDGSYKWAVKAVFTNNVLSVAAFSNMLPILRNDMAALSLSGNVTPSVGMPSVYSVEVKNMGTDPQLATAYTVKLMTGTTELVSVPGVALAPNATNVFPISWTPTTPGALTIFGKVVLTGDSVPTNDQTANLNINVQPAGVLAWTVGDGSQTARIPIDMYFKNSVHQYLIYPAELGNTIGQITGLTYYNQFTQDLLNMPINVWISTTTLADLSGGWLPVTGMTQVFSGTLNFPTGQNSIFIPFSQPYLYLNGENIVLTFQRPLDTQYYNSTNYFKAQTGVPATRARNIYSDSVTYDPAAMPATGGTNTGQFAQTTFHIIPGGVGHLTGTVTGAGNVPLADVSIQFTTGGYTGTTNAQGQYTIQNILPGTYIANFNVYGYVTSTQNLTILEDETTTLNVAMTPMAQVNVTGLVYASDTAAGINGATIHLEGYADYDGNANATGAFTIPGVYANNAYSYVIMAPGYTPAIGTMNVAGTNHNMGTITLNEVAYAPHSVLAAPNAPGTIVDLTWQAPDPNAIEVTESFEAEGFPPENWTQVITNTQGPNTSGVYPTWCRFGAITISGQPATPTDGSYQSGVWWEYTHQDEWLITPSFNCPPGGYLTFDTYVFLGSVNADHYYVKVSVDNGTTWTELWDASAQTGGWNYYASPITIDLNLYGGQQIKLAFNATDGPSDDGLWYVWFIDNIYIGNALTALANPAQTVLFSASDLQRKSAAANNFSVAPVATTNPSRRMELGGYRSEPSLPRAPEYGRDREPERMLTGYKVWRLTQGQENNESAWTLLTPTIITGLSQSDPGWQIVPNGQYRWAVKAFYTNGVTSVPSFSNILVKIQQTGMIAGVVRRSNNVPIQGATVSAAGFNATTNTVGAYTLVLPVGTYDVTCSATGYNAQTATGITVNNSQTTTLNFVMTVGNEDNVVPVTATELLGNYPNPFNPETTISYSVKEPAPVRIEIYNAKGQRVRTLVNESQVTGFYNLLWNGKDDNGQSVSSGVYMYRMTAGSYTSSRKMILMQ